MELSDFEFGSLNSALEIANFDCVDTDINDFLKDDAINYQHQKIANTYCFFQDNKVVAFFSISNDCLNDLGYTNTVWNKFHRKTKLPNEKRIRQ